MRKLILIMFIFMITIADAFAYAIKVYDEYGNRVGTYRKVGDKYEFYDFYDNKVENAQEIIKNAPTQKTLSEVSRTLYDENLMPIGTFTNEIYYTGRYYHRRYSRPAFSPLPRGPYIVRPRAYSFFEETKNKMPTPGLITP